MAEGHKLPDRFDFTEGLQTGVITCRKVAEGAPVLMVAHDEDGAWQFLCGRDHPDDGEDGAVLACIGCTVAGDPSLNAVAGLGCGQEAIRADTRSPWRSTAEDERWQRVLARKWTCGSCGTVHEGLFDIAYGKPDQWTGSEDKQANSEARGSSHFLSEDFCVLEGEHFFVRCVLLLPLRGTEGKVFGFGVWSTLSEKSFALYRETFDSGQQGSLGPWFGWFSNRLRGYPDTLNVKCQVHPRSGRLRPWIEITETEHPLAMEQREGITLERLGEILALHGHSLDPELLRLDRPSDDRDRDARRSPWWKRLWSGSR